MANNCKVSVFFFSHFLNHHHYQQTQIPDYAELIVKFLDALIDSYLPAADEERGEEQLRTPTSPYPPTSQSQLSITANLNLSNSMTSLATSQHSPGEQHSSGASGGASAACRRRRRPKTFDSNAAPASESEWLAKFVFAKQVISSPIFFLYCCIWGSGSLVKKRSG